MTAKKFRRKFWPKTRTDGLKDSEVHNFNIWGTTYMYVEIKIERLIVFEK